MIDVNVGIKVSGFYKIEAISPDGEVKLLADWFGNIITNSGLNALGTIWTGFNYCQVGTGNTTPVAEDTALAGYVAGTSSKISSIAGNQVSELPYYASRTDTFQFSAGAAEGVLSEVGIGKQSSPGGLSSRALILDSEGSPTTITVLSDEILKVSYEFRAYAPTSDTTGSFVLNGVTTNWTARACHLSDSFAFNCTDTDNMRESDSHNAYAGPIVDVMSLPSGSQYPVDSYSVENYDDSSYELDLTMFWGLSKANWGGGIGCIAFKLGFSRWQIGFEPKIAKDSTKTLTLTPTVSWSRAL